MKENLINDILSEPPSHIASKWIIERIPYIFNGNLELYIDWKERLSSLIQVDSKAIVLTGSSSIGYSINPVKNLSQFVEKSDIDVAIISNHFFDIAWHTLRNIGNKYHRLSVKEKNAVDDHIQRLIYHGTIATDKIIQLLPFGQNWVTAISEMSKIEPTKNRTINFRIYKDFEALKSYQTHGIKKIRDVLLND